MAKFRYAAIDRYGNRIRGTVEAVSRPAAQASLKEQGLWITSLVNSGSSIWHKELELFAPRVKHEHFTLFCRQLATLYRSGIPLVQAVRILESQVSNKVFKNILRQVADDMESGTALADACAKYPSVYAPLFINLTRAGEAGGNLDEMLEHLAVYYETEHRTRQKVGSAMIYPIIMGFSTVIVIMILMMFVVPQLSSNFLSMGMELPLPTRIVIAVSDFTIDYWPIVVGLCLAPIVAVLWLRRFPRGRYALDYLKLKLPVFGKLVHKQALSRFSRTFSSLFAASMPILQMLRMVAAIVGNEVVASVIRDAHDSVENGKSIAEPFKRSWVFPPMVVQMLAIGEQSSQLDSMLGKVADFYEADVDMMADRLKAMLEPIMILILAAIVGAIVLAVMLPSFMLMDNLGSS